MGILDDLTPTQRTYSCKVKSVAESLDKDDRAKFMEAIDNPKWTSRALAEELAKRGILISRYPIENHRRKVCQCWKI